MMKHIVKSENDELGMKNLGVGPDLKIMCRCNQGKDLGREHPGLFNPPCEDKCPQKRYTE